MFADEALWKAELPHSLAHTHRPGLVSAAPDRGCSGLSGMKTQNMKIFVSENQNRMSVERVISSEDDAQPSFTGLKTQ